ncbi:MAG: 3-hydroxyacyl-CoA dehydrogenase [Leucobacter sp.]
MPELDSGQAAEIAVIGAGAMGRGIAQVAAVAGYEVALYDVVDGASTKALAAISVGLDESVVRGKLTGRQAAESLARVHAVRRLADVSGSKLVIEAVIEDLAVKQSLFTELEAIASPSTVLASNTSSLSIGSIAAAMKDRDRLIGLHFFNPVPAMKLVEIVLRPGSTILTRSTAIDFVERIGKTGVVVSDSPGFLVNLAGRAYVTEALAITRDSIASVPEVDRIAREVLGFPLGPFELMDLTGVDVNYPVTANLFEQNFGDPKLRSTWEHRYLLDSGNLGRKTGAGFYKHNGNQTPEESQKSAPYESDTGDVAKIACAGSPALEKLLVSSGVSLVGAEVSDLVVVDPVGMDLHTYTQMHGLDPRRTVAVDTFVESPAVLTLMVAPGTDAGKVQFLIDVLERKVPIVVINDSAGFIAQRLLAAVVNLGCEIAQRGVAAPEEIDRAVRLGLRYPMGPLEWADDVGGETIVEILEGILTSTGDARYRTSTWLARRASAGISCLTEDFVSAARRNV